ncbi:hypothetical protein AB0K15_30985 [Amycolatopsis sp. NPDC049253]|uniref:hypothetical protein n=1 Tax=Amycolatopsis sp. NPDC049253 TaxID=3155274 RepID=UPI003432355E
MKIDPPRPLTAKERAILDLVLSPDFAGAAELRHQSTSAVVVGRCACGCPSVDLRTEDSAPIARPGSRLVPSELEVLPSGDEPPGQVILFTDGGRLSYLEYVWFGEPSTEWPELSRVRVVGP